MAGRAGRTRDHGDADESLDSAAANLTQTTITPLPSIPAKCSVNDFRFDACSQCSFTHSIVCSDGLLKKILDGFRIGSLVHQVAA